MKPTPETLAILAKSPETITEQEHTHLANIVEGMTGAKDTIYRLAASDLQRLVAYIYR